MPSDIATYHAAQTGESKALCVMLQKIITETLKKAEGKVWHGSPVWFLDGNPVVGYGVRKRGVQLLFWSGQSFRGVGLQATGSFYAAEKYYESMKDLKRTVLKQWLTQAKRMQWDYKNIVKNRGKLNKIGAW